MEIIDILKKYKELILYVVFGVLTTLVNIVAFIVSYRLIGCSVLFSNIIAWLLSVLFAYITNRIFVFSSENSGAKAICKEIFSFFIGRIGTGVLDTFLMYITVDVLLLDDLAMKIIVNVIVVVLNFVLSKFIIFKKKEDLDNQ